MNGNSEVLEVWIFGLEVLVVFEQSSQLVHILSCYYLHVSNWIQNVPKHLFQPFNVRIVFVHKSNYFVFGYSFLFLFLENSSVMVTMFVPKSFELCSFSLLDEESLPQDLYFVWRLMCPINNNISLMKYFIKSDI